MAASPYIAKNSICIILYHSKNKKSSFGSSKHKNTHAEFFRPLLTYFRPFSKMAASRYIAKNSIYIILYHSKNKKSRLGSYKHKNTNAKFFRPLLTYFRPFYKMAASRYIAKNSICIILYDSKNKKNKMGSYKYKNTSSQIVRPPLTYFRPFFKMAASRYIAKNSICIIFYDSKNKKSKIGSYKYKNTNFQIV